MIAMLTLQCRLTGFLTNSFLPDSHVTGNLLEKITTTVAVYMSGKNDQDKNVFIFFVSVKSKT